MFFKVLLFIVLLFLAYGLAVILLRRLTDTSQRLAELHQQMARNDEKLYSQMQRLRELQETQSTAPASTAAPDATVDVSKDKHI